MALLAGGSHPWTARDMAGLREYVTLTVSGAVQAATEAQKQARYWLGRKHASVEMAGSKACISVHVHARAMLSAIANCFVSML